MSTRQTDSILVQDVMMTLDQVPVVRETTLFKEALEAMGRKRLGIALIVSDTGTLSGIITDGDIRRKILKVQKPFSALLVDDSIDHAIVSPTTIQAGDKLTAAVELMETKQVWDLPVLDADGKLLGLLHLHPALKKMIEISK